MHRFWFDSPITKNKVILQGDIFHHVCRVCRFDVNGVFVLVAPEGMQYTVEIEDKEKDRAIAKVIQIKQAEARKKPYIHLCLSCPRFSTLESLIKKLVELDISDLHLFTSDFSFIKKKNSIPTNRHQRWQSIIQHSMAQSLGSKGFCIHPVESCSNVLSIYKNTPASKAIFFYEGDSSKTIYQSLNDIKTQNLEHIWLFLGGEGGFSANEVEEFYRQSIPSTSLGSSILKVETACLTAVSLVKYECKTF